MIKIFDYLFQRFAERWWSNRDTFNDNSSYSTGTRRGNKRRNFNISNESGMHFTVHRASGGYVVEIQHYDAGTDTEVVNLHIINEGQDLGIELGRIFTVETLRM
jgi:hypothetical protein